MQIDSIAPTRVDLAGGTLDLWPLHHLVDQCATVNFGIDVFAHAIIKTTSNSIFEIESLDRGRVISGSYDKVLASKDLPLLTNLLRVLWNESLPALSITTKSESPVGAGLGGSSALSVAICKGLVELKNRLTGSGLLEDYTLARKVQDIEARVIHAPTGCQDYWGAIRGGINIIEYPEGDVQVETLDPSTCDQLNSKLVVCYSGQSRASACNNWNIYKNVFERDKETISTIEEIGFVAGECAKALKQGDVDSALTHSEHEWKLRQKLWPDIETEKTKQLTKIGRENGASFSRVCGAGGGGVMVFFCQPDSKNQLCQKLEQAGGTIIQAKVVESGARTAFHD